VDACIYFYFVSLLSIVNCYHDGYVNNQGNLCHHAVEKGWAVAGERGPIDRVARVVEPPHWQYYVIPSLNLSLAITPNEYKHCTTVFY
jgi:hypothetical protein